MAKQKTTLVTEKKFEKPILTKEDIVNKLKKIFRKHIGSDNPTTKYKLYKKIFGDPTLYDPYELWYNWHRIRTCMNWLRRTTKYFVVCKPNDKYSIIWEYYLPTSDFEIEPYQQLLVKTRGKINYMIKRAQKAVDEKFYLAVQNNEE